MRVDFRAAAQRAAGVSRLADLCVHTPHDGWSVILDWRSARERRAARNNRGRSTSPG
jgi:hypothetical protein